MKNSFPLLLGVFSLISMSAPVQGQTAPAPRAAQTPDGPGRARVLIEADRIGVTLELRSFGDLGPWTRACLAPCGTWLLVDGMQARVTADGMTPSTPFRIDPGHGSALLSVDAGSAGARLWGRVALIAGIPLGLASMASYGTGFINDREQLKTVGLVGMGVSAALILVAMPLLVSGSTEVRNASGDLIASRAAPTSF